MYMSFRAHPFQWPSSPSCMGEGGEVHLGTCDCGHGQLILSFWRRFHHDGKIVWKILTVPTRISPFLFFMKTSSKYISMVCWLTFLYFFLLRLLFLPGCQRNTYPHVTEKRKEIDNQL
jgi:hypothetical protein